MEVPQPVDPLVTLLPSHVLESDDPAATHQPTKRCPPLAVFWSMRRLIESVLVKVLVLAREYH